GTLFLTGDNTHLGTTVTAGSLTVEGFQPNSPVSVQGGILTGNGTVGGISATGGSVIPGESVLSGSHVMTSDGNVTLTGPALFEVSLNGTTAGSSHNQ